MTRTISGMISPALRKTTVSPILTSNWAMRSLLWRVALCTVVPPNCTGCINAIGVTAPVLPTLIVISLTTVGTVWAGYFKAIAQRGNLWVKPNSLCK